MKIHIPTEQYGFIEAEVETPEQALELSNEIKQVFAPKSGLSQQDFNKALDRYLTDGTGETETYLAMSDYQKSVIQEIKKAYKRLETLQDE